MSEVLARWHQLHTLPLLPCNIWVDTDAITTTLKLTAEAQSLRVGAVTSISLHVRQIYVVCSASTCL